MLKESTYPKVFERHEVTLQLRNGSKFDAFWKSRIHSYRSCGPNGFKIEAYEPLIDTVRLRRQGDPLMQNEYDLSLFNELHQSEPLDFSCNCHGLTFTCCSYMLPNREVGLILEDEFEPVLDTQLIEQGDYDVVCFKKDGEDEWLHSCRRLLDYFVHKEGLRSSNFTTSIDHIIETQEYRGCRPYYFRRMMRSCSGICKTSIPGPDELKK